MQRSSELGWISRRLRSGALLSQLVVALASVVVACATPTSNRPQPLETRDEGGFSITETARVGLRARASFDQAVRALDREEYENGIELLLEVSEAEPQLTAALINLGIAYAKVGDLDRAEVSLQKALEVNSRHPVAHNELGIVYRRMGRFEQARKSYEAALALHPEFHFARKNLGILCDLYLGEPSCALENYELYLENVPDDEMAEIWIADLRNRMNR